MSPPPQIQARTGLFARVLGPYLIVAALTMVARASDMRTLLAQFDADSVWPWITGAFVLPMGLVVIVLHPYWRGAAATIVSLLGWLTAFKGLALMAFPHAYLSMGNNAVGVSPWWQVGTVIVALVGLYLTVIGWIPAASRPMTRSAARPPRDLPRVA
jgi:hypothetical protein